MERKRIGVIRLTVRERGEFFLGTGLMIMGFIMPLLLTVENFGVLHSLFQALRHMEKTDLLFAAVRLVLLNTLRAAPHYVGVFCIAESLEFQIGQWKNAWVLNAILVLGAFQLTYVGIDALLHVHYDFGLSALLVVALVLLFDKLDYKYIALKKKALLITMGLAAFWFLDVMPAARRLPVGRGEMSRDIKTASMVLEADPVMNLMSAAGLVLFSLFALMIFIQLRDENRLRELNILQVQNEAIRTQAQINEMKNRTYQEMQHLVHDLKSPLTVVQTLVDVLKIGCETERRTGDLECLTQIEGAVDRMNGMISEILYEDSTRPETAEKLVARAMTMLSVEPYVRYIQVELVSPQARVRVNRVLFPRALINLIENSVQAIPEGRTPSITVRVDTRDGWVRFQVRDNGRGVPPERQKDIWKRGYSGSGSSGLGLAFVENLVERCQGYIQMDSTPGVGTSITLLIPEEEREHEQ